MRIANLVDTKIRGAKRILGSWPAFLVVLPVLLALLFGLRENPQNDWAVAWQNVVYYYLNMQPQWLCAALGSFAAARLLRKRGLPLWGSLIFGYLAGSLLLWLPIRVSFLRLFADNLIAGVTIPPESYVASARAIGFALSGLAIWTLCALARFRWLRKPMFGYELPQVTAPSEDDAKPKTPRLVARLPGSLSGDVLALEAQEHYTKVYCEVGSCLLLMRFSDAIKEMDSHPGIRVHRSHWVSDTAVARIRREGRNRVLRLKDGREVPVSRSRIKNVERRFG